MNTVGFILAIASLLLVLLFVTAVYVVLRRRREEETPAVQIHHSGVYRLRQSSREGGMRGKPSRDEVADHLARTRPDIDASLREKLALAWAASLEASMRVLEEADQRDTRTFGYEIPGDAPKEIRALAVLYVTRDQISSHPELIPPFHPGCQARLRPRNAWEEGEWKPFLPGNSGSNVPDWRSLGPQ